MKKKVYINSCMEKYRKWRRIKHILILKITTNLIIHYSHKFLGKIVLNCISFSPVSYLGLNPNYFNDRLTKFSTILLIHFYKKLV